MPLLRNFALPVVASIALIACSGEKPADKPSTPTPPATEEPATPRTAPAIWKVADDDTTIYLFGTVHLLQNNVEWRSETFNEIWQSAGTVYFETDATSPEAASRLQPLMQQYGMNPAGTTFSSFFSEEDYAFIKEEAAKINLPTAMLEPMRPWLAGLLISVQQLTAKGANPAAGVDSILSEEARNSDRVLRYFETNEEQIRFFADFSDEVSANMVIENLRQAKENPDLFKELVSLWQSGDTEALGDLINETLLETGEHVARVLLYDRNKRWVDELTTVLNEEEGTFFVAVGAGHLAGKNSVQDYFMEKGITAERL
jgi:hypothetical protein